MKIIITIFHSIFILGMLTIIVTIAYHALLKDDRIPIMAKALFVITITAFVGLIVSMALLDL